MSSLFNNYTYYTKNSNGLKFALIGDLDRLLLFLSFISFDKLWSLFVIYIVSKTFLLIYLKRNKRFSDYEFFKIWGRINFLVLFLVDMLYYFDIKKP